MHSIKLSTFAGLFPRLTSTLLPVNAATIAQNCDFAYGELRSLKDHYLLKTLAENVASIFSEDGLRFYTWPTDTNAAISPIGSGEASARLYYTTNGDFRVTSRSGATTSGGSPGTSFRVGVPVPTVAPIVAVDVDAATMDIAGLIPVATFHYEANGIKYQEEAINVTAVTEGKKYTFTLPERAVSAISGEDRATRIRDLSYDPYSEELDDPTPTNAVPVLRMVFRTSPQTLFVQGEPMGMLPGDVKLDQYSNNSSLAKSTGLVITLKQDATNSALYTAEIGTGESAEDMSTRAYTYTVVNIYNEEGVPSPPAVVTSAPSAKITIACTLPSVGQYVPFKEVRVYRTQNGGTSSEYFYAFSISAIGASGLVSSVDAVVAGMLNEPLSSLHYYPPKPSLQGLINVGNGIFAAWFGSELWFSDAYKPWSWPPSYMKSFGWPIVGVEAQGSGMIVTTLGNPYLVYGISPDSMTEDKLNVDQAGVSKWSIASVSGVMIYASNDGLVTINGGQGALRESQAYFTREVWREKYGNHLGAMQFAEYDGALLVFSRSNAFTAFLLRMDEGKGAMTELPGLVASSIFYLVTSDGLYFSKGRELYQFGGATELPLVWQSKEFRLLKPTGYSVCQVIADGAFSIEFWTKDESDTRVLRHTETITPIEKKKTFRLPGGFTSDSWQIKVSGTGRFKQVVLANSGRQLGVE